jgi:thiol-disulfide isomerase/thioredoxin
VILRKDSVITLLIISLVVVIVAAFTWFTVKNNNERNVADNPAMRSLSVAEGEQPYTDLSGNPLSLTDHVGEIIVVNSWASWIPDSVKELQALAEISKIYRDQGVVILAINRAEPTTTVRRFLETLGVIDGVELVLDRSDRYYQKSQGYAVPETIFYDREGKIVHHQHGSLTEEEMKKYLEMSLATESAE